DLWTTAIPTIPS
nr:Chain P, Dodecapeptide (dlwttaiptips) [synthetic construct]